jgi:hypothetical protein
MAQPANRASRRVVVAARMVRVPRPVQHLPRSAKTSIRAIHKIARCNSVALRSDVI